MATDADERDGDRARPRRARRDGGAHGARARGHHRRLPALGTELQHCPNPQQPQLLRLPPAGRRRPHRRLPRARLPGAGYSGRTYVAYGLGNLAFAAKGAPRTDSGILHATDHRPPRRQGRLAPRDDPGRPPDPARTAQPAATRSTPGAPCATAPASPRSPAAATSNLDG